MAEIKRNKTMIEAFIELQKELPKLDKKADNPFFKSKYVPLEEVIGKILPLLNKHGFGLMQAVNQSNGTPVLDTSLIYQYGATTPLLQSSMPLMLKSEDPQAQGSAITYARRYALMALLGLVGDEDDDGNRASQPETKAEGFDRKATPNQLNALRNMVIGFSNRRVQKDSVDQAIMQIVGIDNLNDLKFQDASELMDEIKRTKQVPLDFDENERDYDREEENESESK